MNSEVNLNIYLENAIRMNMLETGEELTPAFKDSILNIGVTQHRIWYLALYYYKKFEIII